FNREIMGYKSLFLKTLGVYLVSSFTINAQVIQFERFYDETLAQASYIIANEDKEAIVIDPKRDIDTYISYAKEKGLMIKYVTETHIHVDYLSRAPELANAIEAILLLSNQDGPDWQYGYVYQPLKD